MSRFCRLFADLCLYFMEECGKVIHGYGMRRKGERLGAALRLMTKPDCEGTRVPGGEDPSKDRPPLSLPVTPGELSASA